MVQTSYFNGLVIGNFMIRIKTSSLSLCLIIKLCIIFV